MPTLSLRKAFFSITSNYSYFRPISNRRQLRFTGSSPLCQSKEQRHRRQGSVRLCAPEYCEQRVILAARESPLELPVYLLARAELLAAKALQAQQQSRVCGRKAPHLASQASHHRHRGKRFGGPGTTGALRLCRRVAGDAQRCRHGEPGTTKLPLDNPNRCLFLIRARGHSALMPVS